MKKQYFWDYLHFTRVERWGAALLLCCCLGFVIAPHLYEWLRPQPAVDIKALIEAHEASRQHQTEDAPADAPTFEDRQTLFQFDPNTASAEQLKQLGLPDRTISSIVKYRQKGGKFRQPDDFQKIYTLNKADFERLLPYIQIGGQTQQAPENIAPTAEIPAPASFSFDPNTVTAEDLRQLGLSQRTVEGWLHFREKGGRFRQVTDVQRLYSLAEKDYLRLLPLMVIAAATENKPTTTRAYPARAIAAVDLNAATSDELEALPGIGAGWARRILNFRDKLGGFVSVDQVAETRGLPDSVYQKARPYLMLKSGVFGKININAATQEELTRHPYADFYQTRRLLAYRNEHGPISSVEELSKQAAFDKKWLSRIAPYLSF